LIHFWFDHRCFTTFYLNYPLIERDYEILKASRSLQMIESDNAWKQFTSDLIQDEIIHSLPNGDILSGDSLIDEQLNEVLRLAFRDYINSWYAFISPNQEFTCQLYNIAQLAIKSVAQRFLSLSKSSSQ